MGFKVRTPRRRAVIFETERLEAKPWRLVDAPDAFVMYGDPLVVKHIGGRLETSVAGQREFLRKMNARYVGREHFGGWALWERASGQIVGSVLIKPLPNRDMQPSHHIEIGWHLRRDRWGEGFATEAGAGVRDYAFERLGLDRVVAVVEPENVASLAVAKRLCMKPFGATTAFYGGITLEYFESTRESVQNAIGVSEEQLAETFEHPSVQAFARHLKWQLADGVLQKNRERKNS